MKNENGFSLVELLIVVAIIAIIAAIAVPSLLTSRQAANEASAIQGLRTIGSAEIAFAATNNQQFTDLTSLATGTFLDGRFSVVGDFINGYSFVSEAITTDTGVTYDPVETQVTSFSYVARPNTGLGRFEYGIGPDQVVRWVAVSASAPTGTVMPSPPGTPIGLQAQ
jgi:type IV pilus assembly protein PilA